MCKNRETRAECVKVGKRAETRRRISSTRDHVLDKVAEANWGELVHAHFSFSRLKRKCPHRA